MRIGIRRGERGQSVVEAALVLPLLVIMMAIVVDLGRAFFAYTAVIDAAREGARYGVTNQNSTDMCNRAKTEAQDQLLLKCNNPGLSCVADTGHGSGTPVRVTVSCNFPLIMGSLFGKSSILISYAAAFRIR
jgi:Flp pilus assembly protein TadG